MGVEVHWETFGSELLLGRNGRSYVESVMEKQLVRLSFKEIRACSILEETLSEVRREPREYLKEDQIEIKFNKI